MCTGTVACADFSAAGCPLDIGCVIDQGQCSVSRTLCGVDVDCPVSEVCEGSSCAGMVTCSQFSVVQDTCEGSGAGEYGAYCSWSICSTWADEGTCESNSCIWNCNAPLLEVCSNGVDDGDADPAIDCEDAACQHGYSWTDAEALQFNCLGNGVDSDTDLSAAGLTHYCASDTLLDPTIGLCCPEGKYLDYVFGTWGCFDTMPCLAPEGLCDFEYSVDPLNSWIGDGADCLNTGAPLACCNVVIFGETNYWSDSGNVKVY